MQFFVMLLSLYGESNFLNYNNRSCANTMGIYTCVQGILNMADKTAGQLESTLHVNKGAFDQGLSAGYRFSSGGRDLL